MDPSASPPNVGKAFNPVPQVPAGHVMVDQRTFNRSRQDDDYLKRVAQSLQVQDIEKRLSETTVEMESAQLPQNPKPLVRLTKHVLLHNEQNQRAFSETSAEFLKLKKSQLCEVVFETKKLYDITHQNVRYERNTLNLFDFAQTTLYHNKLSQLASSSTNYQRQFELSRQPIMAEELVATFLLRAAQEEIGKESYDIKEIDFISSVFKSKRDQMLEISDLALEMRRNTALDTVTSNKLLQVRDVSSTISRFYDDAQWRLYDVRDGKDNLVLYGPQDLSNAKAIMDTVNSSSNPIAGTYVHFVQWPKGFITQDQGCTGDIKSRILTRRSETRREGSNSSKTVLTFSLGQYGRQETYQALEDANINEVLFEKTLQGQSYAIVQFEMSEKGYIVPYRLPRNYKIPLATTLNANVSGSPVAFPAEYMEPLKEKTYAAWCRMHHHPDWVWDVQQGKVSVEEFRNMCEIESTEKEKKNDGNL